MTPVPHILRSKYSVPLPIPWHFPQSFKLAAEQTASCMASIVFGALDGVDFLHVLGLASCWTARSLRVFCVLDASHRHDCRYDARTGVLNLPHSNPQAEATTANTKPTATLVLPTTLEALASTVWTAL